MKLSYILLASPLCVMGLPYPFYSNDPFVPVPLPPPDNWTPSSKLFPSNVISGYSTDYDKFTADTWAEYIKEQCKQFDACTSTFSFAGKETMPNLRFNNIYLPVVSN
jgi:hypothetical protein